MSINPEEDVIPFMSFVSMRDTHRELLQRRRQGNETEEFWAAVQEFLQRGVPAGAILDRDEERTQAQNLLDYWENHLYYAQIDWPESILAEFDPESEPELPDHPCPYVGLNAFDTTNHHLFFGRSQLVDQLLKQVMLGQLVAVVGPSGSGKSSAVLAGLLPKLRNRLLPDSQNWRYYDPIVPGSEPLARLARLLQPPGADPAEWATRHVEQLRQDAHHLTNLINETGSGPAVLVIDQFEETFTLCLDETERQSFINNLLHLIQARGERHILILTMRTDYVSYLNKAPLFQSMFEQSEVRVSAMNANELREAIEKPAEAIGLKFEEGLVDALIREIVGEPAALPLLQFALLQLWDNRERNRVTWETYRRLGGVQQALARTADAIYKSLLPEEQVTTRRILMQIVRPGEGLEVTRNRVRRRMLYLAGEARDRIDRVLDKLIQSRLVHLTTGATPDDDQIEVAHEALVRNWPRLVEWLDEERVALRHRQRLTTRAEQWESLRRDESSLLGETLLKEALEYDDLNELEAAFVKASQEELLREEQEKEESRQRELKLARLAARRARNFAITLGIFVVVVVIGVLYMSGLQTAKTATDAMAQAVAIAGTEEAISGRETLQAQERDALDAQATTQAEQATTQAQFATSQAQSLARVTADTAASATAVAATATYQFESAALQATSAAQTATAEFLTPSSSGPTATPDLEAIIALQKIDAQLNAQVRPHDNAPMLFIAGNTFRMGATSNDAAAGDDEKPPHTVTLPNYFIDQHEVSAQQFATFLNDLGGYRRTCGNSRYDCVKTGFETQYTYLLNNLGIYEPQAGFENYPVNWVSWYGAHDYCTWAGARLPTEAEWEYAARSIDGRIYPWGDESPNRNLAIFNMQPSTFTFQSAFKPVDALPDGASPFGVLGMAGGVWEWVEDWYDADYYATDSGAAVNSNDGSGKRVLRGGSWEDSAGLLRATTRHKLEPDFSNPNELAYWGAGFRCAMTAP